MKDATRAVTAGREASQPAAHVKRSGDVAPTPKATGPVIAPVSQFRSRRAGAGAQGGFEGALAALEGGDHTLLCASGASAVSGALLSFLSTGDHLLMTDSCSATTRRFCDGALRRFGVETTYYDPLIGGAISGLMRDNTRVVFLESPGSWTFEVQDAPAIAAAASARGVWTIMENSWASPLGFKPFHHGADVSIQSSMGLIAGRSGAALGAVTTTKSAQQKLERGWRELGLAAAPEDAAAALGGLRALSARLQRHHETGVKLAEWLFAQSEVAEVLHPALPWDPGHRLWRRDFSGACGLFGFVLDSELSTEAHLKTLLDGLDLFGVGAGWGGPESMILPVEPWRQRTTTVWPRPGGPMGQVMRIHVGLEDAEDLIADLYAGLRRMRVV